MFYHYAGQFMVVKIQKDGFDPQSYHETLSPVTPGNKEACHTRDNSNWKVFLGTAVVENALRLMFNSFQVDVKYFLWNHALYTQQFDYLEGWEDMKQFHNQNDDIAQRFMDIYEERVEPIGLKPRGKALP